jgi:hypothetical protein
VKSEDDNQQTPRADDRILNGWHGGPKQEFEDGEDQHKNCGEPRNEGQPMNHELHPIDEGKRFCFTTNGDRSGCHPSTKITDIRRNEGQDTRR